VLGADGDPGWKARSRHCGTLVPVAPAETAPAAFAADVERVVRERGVTAILPLDDASLRALAERRPELGDAVVVGPDAMQVAAALDKRALVETCAAVGVESPATVLVDGHGPDGPWPALPSIVKSRGNGLPLAAGASLPHTTLVRTAEQRDIAVERFRAAFGEALVQEQVRGQGWRVHFVRTREELASVAVLTVRRYPHVTGLSSVSRTAEAPAALLRACEALLGHVGYRGPGELELIERDGSFVLHDVNLRLSASVAVAIAAGLDVAGLAVADALGLPARATTGTRETLYVTVEGEGAHLVDALLRRPAAAPAWRIAADLAGAALLPGRVLDPFDLRDPRRIAATIAAALARRRPAGAR
jgi:predicted ATP-grasp superfamily ATP-dependent carboligase